MLYRELPFWCEAAGRLYANGPVRSSGKAERQVSLAVFPALMRTDMQVSLKPLGGKAVFYRPIAEGRTYFLLLKQHNNQMYNNLDKE